MILNNLFYSLKRQQFKFAMLIGIAVFGFVAPAKAYVYELMLRESELVSNGREALHQGDMERALTYLNLALKNGVSHIELARVHGDMCVAHYFLRQYDDALAHCNASIEARPNTWMSYNNRGNVYLESGQYDLAIADYEKAMQLNPDSEVVMRNMEIVNFRQQAKNGQDSPLADERQPAA